MRGRPRGGVDRPAKISSGRRDRTSGLARVVAGLFVAGELRGQGPEQVAQEGHGQGDRVERKRQGAAQVHADGVANHGDEG